MSYTLGEAAKAVGKSKPTVQRAIKAGKISAEKKADGSYSIEPAELFRVYPKLPDTGNDNGSMKQNVIPNNNSALEVEVKMLREMLEKTETDRDDWKAQAQKAQDITVLVTDHRDKGHLEAPQQGRGGFLKRLFG